MAVRVAIAAIAVWAGLRLSASSAISARDVTAPAATPGAPGCPPSDAPEVLNASLAYPADGWSFDAAPSQSPAVSADDAVAIACRDDGMPADAVHPIYATAPAGGMLDKDTPVWLVRFTGVCFHGHGGNAHDIGQPGGSPPTCAANVNAYDVVVNAETGAFIAGFTQT